MKKTAIVMGAIVALGMTACAPPAEEDSASEDTMMSEEDAAGDDAMMSEDEAVVDQRTDEGDETEGDDPGGDDRTGPGDRES